MRFDSTLYYHVGEPYRREELAKDDLSTDWFDFQLSHDLILVGSPDSVAEQIDRLRTGLNCQHLVIFLNFPGLPFEKVMRSLNLFAERIMPRFQGEKAS